MKRLSLAAAMLTVLLATITVAESANPIQGTASVIDGDTIEMRGQRIRVDAIDPPKSSQLCLDSARKRYRSGQRPGFALADMVGRTVVSCESKDRDRYKRMIAVCFKNDVNLNA